MSEFLWEPDFALAAYSFALKRWQSKSGKLLYVPSDIDPALWKKLKRQWPRLERQPANRPIGAQTLSLESRWMYPAKSTSYRFSGFSLITAKAKEEWENSYQTKILEARRMGGQWHFRVLPTEPLPRAAELTLYSEWPTPLLLVKDLNGLVAYLRYKGINARSFTTRDDRQDFLYVEVLQTWWPDAKTVYVRVDRMNHPPGHDISYELYGSVRLQRRGSGWTLTDLGDWQGE